MEHSCNIDVGNLTLGDGRLAGVLGPQVKIRWFGILRPAELPWPRRVPDMHLGHAVRPHRRSSRWRIGPLARHDCRAAEKSEQSEDDQGARYPRAPLPSAIATQQDGGGIRILRGQELADGRRRRRVSMQNGRRLTWFASVHCSYLMARRVSLVGDTGAGRPTIRRLHCGAMLQCRRLIALLS